MFFKNNLTDAAWTKLADIPAQPADVLIDVPDPSATSETRRFYRVATPQQP